MPPTLMLATVVLYADLRTGLAGGHAAAPSRGRTDGRPPFYCQRGIERIDTVLLSVTLTAWRLGDGVGWRLGSGHCCGGARSPVITSFMVVRPYPVARD